MLKMETMSRYMRDLDTWLGEWLFEHREAFEMPRNCEMQFLRLDDRGIRLLASAICHDRHTTNWAPGEALSTRQIIPSVLMLRELVAPDGQTMRHIFIYPDGEVDIVEVSDEASRYELFGYLSGLVD